MDLGQYTDLSPKEVCHYLNNTKLEFLIATGRQMLNWSYQSELDISVLRTQLIEFNTLTRLITTILDSSSIPVPTTQAQVCAALIDRLAIRVVNISNWIQEVEAYNTELRYHREE